MNFSNCHPRILSHTTRIEVRYSETDQMGIVYQANYLIWFDLARTELMRMYGQDYARIEKEGIFLPVIKAFLEYKAPAVFGDSIFVETHADRNGRSTLRFRYLCRNQESHVITEGYTEHIFMNHKRKPIKPPQEVRELFD